ncbi:TIM-barrel domain-containing protein [Streptomyces johnsoniae]|uniref:Glycoside hydrolase family 31 protein n=1 Tax=Streptomyces johnsoniae TaxID=3075532 RepID=A0ABU2SCS3_9ACTN|nr:TIM-barrel domain-containing protein [Streptomyces sp. DSM 41886]MDT0446209.1 glycoside hydrolase family 31 protein [Streptomyces sp. DSM 41886]
MFRPTQQRVMEYARAIVEHGLPRGVIMIDDRWHEDYGTWTFHGGPFPDPAAMPRQLRDLGFKVMLWLVPYVTPGTEVFRALRDAGLLIRDRRGRVAIGAWWNGFGAALDLLGPEAVRWLAGTLKDLRRLGVGGFKFDGGEPPFYRSTRPWAARTRTPTRSRGTVPGWDIPSTSSGTRGSRRTSPSRSGSATRFTRGPAATVWPGSSPTRSPNR